MRRFSPSPSTLLLLMSLVLLAAPCGAVEVPLWGAEGVLVRKSDTTNDRNPGIPFPDGAGGGYVIGFSSGPDVDWIQRLSATGAVAPGWPIDGRVFLPEQISNARASVVLDPWGGAYIVTADVYGGRKLEARHYTADGLPAPGWGDSTGLLVLASEWPSVPDAHYAIQDDQGGFFVTWTQRDAGDFADTVRVRRLRSNGTSFPGWPDEGFSLSHVPGVRATSGVVPDGEGGVIVVWTDYRAPGTADVYAQRITGGGVKVWDAFPQGLPVIVSPDRDQGGFVTAPDGAGGVYIGVTDQPAGTQSNDAQFYLQHLTRDGVLAPGYGLLGKPIAVGYPNWRFRLELEPDGAGGVYACWEDYRSGISDFYVQHFGPDGEPVAGWPVGGRNMRPEPDAFDAHGHMCSDMAGGVYCTWQGNEFLSRVFTSHVRGDGTLAPGWPEGGLDTSPGRYGEWPYIGSDLRGGAFVAWNSRRSDFRNATYVQRYGPLTVVATTLSLAGWDAQPDRVTLRWSASDDAVHSAQVQRREGADAPWVTLAGGSFDGEGRMEYEDASVTAGSRYAYRLAYTAAATERHTQETWIDVPVAHRFALGGARPNPARSGALAIAFSLRSGAPASLELFDVNGRRVARREVGGRGAGAHTLRWSEGERVRAGLYWLRLRQGDDAAMARVVVVE